MPSGYTPAKPIERLVNGDALLLSAGEHVRRFFGVLAHADSPKRVENLRRCVVIAVSLFSPGRQRFQRDDGEIGVFQRAGKPLEGRHKIIMIRSLLHAFANGLRRVNRAGGSNRQSFRLKRGRCRRRWAGRRPFGDFGHGRRRRNAGRRCGRFLGLISQQAEHGARPVVYAIPCNQRQERRHTDNDKKRCQQHHDAAQRKPRLFHGVPSFSTFQIYYTPKSSFRKDTKRAEPACISAVVRKTSKLYTRGQPLRSFLRVKKGLSPPAFPP